jgi:AcrR family transcriptional regulator
MIMLDVAHREALTRRDELLAKAAHLFRVKGYHATTMKDIAAELDILPGSLYHHISSKESLLVEIMQRGIEVLLERVRPVALGESAPLEKLRHVVHIHVDAITSYPDVLTVFLHEVKSLPPDKQREQLRLRDEYEQLIKHLIKEGQARGEFRAMRPRMATNAILGMVNWLYSWYRPGGGLSPAQIADEFLTLITGGLVPPPTNDAG